MSKTRIGLVGAGGIPRVHLPQLKRRSDAVELVAVADINPEAAAATAEEHGFARWATDYRQILPEVDAVIICVPQFLHHEVGAAALDAGKHVFCEKPLTRTLEQANVLLQAAQRSSAQLQVGFVRRFDKEWLAFGRAVQEAKIGRPVVWRDVLAIPGPTAPWFNKDEMGGGPFLDGCIHNIDFALYTFGPAEWAFCHGRTLRDGNTAIDTGTATVRFASGDELLLAWSWGLPKGISGGRVFEIFGPKGIMTWPANEPGDDTRRVVISTAHNRETLSFPPTCLQEAFDAQMDEFIAVTRGEAKPRAGGTEGLESLKLALAILESGRTGEVVRL
jgi:predicted dehydrogenase